MLVIDCEDVDVSRTSGVTPRSEYVMSIQSYRGQSIYKESGVHELPSPIAATGVKILSVEEEDEDDDDEHNKGMSESAVLVEKQDYPVKEESSHRGSAP